MDLALPAWLILIAGAGVAGWIDAVIGGGGLILIPLILAVAPGLAPVTALASNKLAAVSGTASAAFSLCRKVGVDRSLVIRFVPVAAVCSAGGALAASAIDKSLMRPIVIVLMVAAGVFVALRPSFGTGVAREAPKGVRRLIAVGAVALIAGYDGIFGPGTGMFLIMVFTGVLSQNFLTSAALAKVVNTATNVGALLVFAVGGHIWWTLGLVLAVANIAGAQIGARTVVRGGTGFIRAALLCMVIVMSSYLTYTQILGG
ncbi:TSUP family transporter [Corynebacterium sp. TAE3-ERU16]|uniref:TSUP family transporter n=1 Tax=Corynebacterium sp. TAE3-ERU16 TaxID=2849493 RepID=UPI001C43B4EC|nr:TSUP family transporter [Corynebacterium sp. TAE3-ERU16]MBV7293455.1 TSUP family transporter [Corynebacterium sp. TAE3-ERU16]